MNTLTLPSIEIQKKQVEAFKLGLNPSTLMAAIWEQPSPEDVRIILKIASLTGGQAADIVKVNARTVRKWTGGETPIPYAAWCLLVEKAGLGEIWKVKQ